jgi:NAD(P)H-dependent flavin oxidoreductase YrpB (nitropropane dioxygenase family)
VFSTAWPRDDQDLPAIFAKAHDRGCRVMHMVSRVQDAVRAADAGADVIVAQGKATTPS